jgi:hypothetical protein
VRLKGLAKLKNAVASSGIESATFRLVTFIQLTLTFITNTYTFWWESNSIFTIHVAYVRKYCCVEIDRDFDGFAGFIPPENDSGVHYISSVKALRYPGSRQFLSFQCRACIAF